MSEQLKTAFGRALIIGILTAASTGLTTWGSMPPGQTDVRALIVAIGTAFLAPFLVRFGVEGGYDTGRAKKGKVQPSDITSLPTQRRVA